MEIKEQKVREFTLTYEGETAIIYIRPPKAIDAISFIMLGEFLSGLSGKGRMPRLCVDLIEGWSLTDESGEAWPITYDGIAQLPLSIYTQIIVHVNALIKEAVKVGG